MFLQYMGNKSVLWSHFLCFFLLLGSYGMEYLAEQMKEKKKKCICINEGGKNFWQKTTIIIFIVSVSVMMYAEISQSVTVHKEWEVHCADIGSDKKNKRISETIPSGADFLCGQTI